MKFLTSQPQVVSSASEIQQSRYRNSVFKPVSKRSTKQSFSPLIIAHSASSSCSGKFSGQDVSQSCHSSGFNAVTKVTKPSAKKAHQISQLSLKLNRHSSQVSAFTPVLKVRSSQNFHNFPKLTASPSKVAVSKPN